MTLPNKSNQNIFLFWSGPMGKPYKDMFFVNLMSIEFFNPDKFIYIYSNHLNQSDFSDFKNVLIVKFTYESLTLDTPIEKCKSVKEVYAKNINNGRVFCELFRFVILYKYGGSYVDTDNLCIKKIHDNKNSICRTYDPHCSHIHKLQKELISGKEKKEQKHTDIDFFLRSDCLLNFDPEHNFIKEYLKKICDIILDKPFGADYNTTQGLLTRHFSSSNDDSISIDLNLIYLYEDFLSNDFGVLSKKGELFEIYQNISSLESFSFKDFKSYRPNETEASKMIKEITKTFSYAPFLWLCDKTRNEDISKKRFSKNMRLSSFFYKKIIDQF